MSDWNFNDWFDQNYDPSSQGFSDSVDVTGSIPFADTILPGLSTGLSSEELGGYGDQGPQIDGSTGSQMASSWLKKLLGGSQPGQNMTDLSSVLGGFSSGEKANRVIQGNFTQNYDRLMMEAQQARNQNESDALKKLAQTSYITGGGSKFTPPSLTLNGKTYAPMNLGLGPTPISDVEKQGASALQGQLVGRLSPGGSYTPQPLNDYAKPGTAESIGNYGGLATGGLGALGTIFGGDGSTGSTGGPSGLEKGIGIASTGAGIASKLGLLGNGASSAAEGGAGAAGGAGGGILGAIGSKAIPIAGAGLGIYNLIKGGSTGSNIMNGVGSGASIGSLFGGPIGAGIGAGVGALAGWIRGMGAPSQTELQGRDIEGNFEKSLGGFNGMMNKVGTGYASAGHSSQEAQADVKAMLDAEKQGPQATQAALMNILSKMKGVSG